MAGRFPLYTDADIQGQVVKALKRAGWDVLRAIEAFPEGEDDLVHFERAVELGRVLVTNDEGQRQRGADWYGEGLQPSVLPLRPGGAECFSMV